VNFVVTAGKTPFQSAFDMILIPHTKTNFLES
jgi:hypothetical protein